MLEELNPRFRVVSKQRPASASEISELQGQFADVPAEYLELIREATEIELEWDDALHLRVWSPAGCIEMDEAYDISKRISGAIPVGDDGGGRVLMYMSGQVGPGLYTSGYGDLTRDDAKWIAGGLRELLTSGVGVEHLTP